MLIGEPEVLLLLLRTKVIVDLAGLLPPLPLLKVTLLSILINWRLYPLNNLLVVFLTPTNVVVLVVAMVLSLNWPSTTSNYTVWLLNSSTPTPVILLLILVAVFSIKKLLPPKLLWTAMSSYNLTTIMPWWPLLLPLVPWPLLLMPPLGTIMNPVSSTDVATPRISMSITLLS